MLGSNLFPLFNFEAQQAMVGDGLSPRKRKRHPENATAGPGPSTLASRTRARPPPSPTPEINSDSSELPERIFPLLKPLKKRSEAEPATPRRKERQPDRGTQSATQPYKRPRGPLVKLGHFTINSDGEDVEELEKRKRMRKKPRKGSFKGGNSVVDLSGNNPSFSPRTPCSVRIREEGNTIVIISSDEEVEPLASSPVRPKKPPSCPPVVHAPETAPDPEPTIDSDPPLQQISTPPPPVVERTPPPPIYEPGQLQAIYNDALQRSIERHKNRPNAPRRKHPIFQSRTLRILPPITYSDTPPARPATLLTPILFEHTLKTFVSQPDVSPLAAQEVEADPPIASSPDQASPIPALEQHGSDPNSTANPPDPSLPAPSPSLYLPPLLPTEDKIEDDQSAHDIQMEDSPVTSSGSSTMSGDSISPVVATAEGEPDTDGDLGEPQGIVDAAIDPPSDGHLREPDSTIDGAITALPPPDSDTREPEAAVDTATIPLLSADSDRGEHVVLVEEPVDALLPPIYEPEFHEAVVGEPVNTPIPPDCDALASEIQVAVMEQSIYLPPSPPAPVSIPSPALSAACQLHPVVTRTEDMGLSLEKRRAVSWSAWNSAEEKLNGQRGFNTLLLQLLNDSTAVIEGACAEAAATGIQSSNQSASDGIGTPLPDSMMGAPEDEDDDDFDSGSLELAYPD